MRADARRRRDAIISTACSLARTRHEDAIPLEEIAQEAGVGIATLYRNFPDRLSLRQACAEFLIHKATTLLEVADHAITILEEEHQHGAPSAFSLHIEKIWDQLMWDLVELGLGTLMPIFAPNDIASMSPDIREKFDHVIGLLDNVLTHVHRIGLIDRQFDGITIVIGLSTASRPQVPGLSSLVPDLEKQMVRIFLRGLRPVS
ncbi:TetR family transcriptional regulator [Corynebacterium poyangense]|uniref:TetR family transcriptional regulator n=1 Tax=Corynebacterium poyangense TaxID=2684405 RepID=A0A7H0SP40_9CORY|nr:TetR/AcrR family transcriptional regulator [Corynebacterium poyangense]MBZ8177883.1 TetR family transcriptional regulator [Corynebacterium poyangense]QNQ90315.1 TetR family transcriptional regulator [Corynebacterium poyangense]